MDSFPKKTNDRQEKMSRALGAAFLSHQVAELEKSVGNMQVNNNNRTRGGGGRGGGRGRGGRMPDTSRGPVESKPRLVKQPHSADRIIIDASVLIHALNQVKNWCREDRKETLIVPLEG